MSGVGGRPPPPTLLIPWSKGMAEPQVRVNWKQEKWRKIKMKARLSISSGPPVWPTFSSESRCIASCQASAALCRSPAPGGDCKCLVCLLFFVLLHGYVLGWVGRFSVGVQRCVWRVCTCESAVEWVEWRYDATDWIEWGNWILASPGGVIDVWDCFLVFPILWPKSVQCYFAIVLYHCHILKDIWGMPKSQRRWRIFGWSFPGLCFFCCGALQTG